MIAPRPPGGAIARFGVEAAELTATLMTCCFADQETRPWHAEELAALIAQSNSLLLVAQRPCDDPAGFLLARHGGGEAEILSLGVVPQYRRQNIGLSLIRQAADILKTYGIRRIVLEVRADNEPACKLYASDGFLVAGRRHDYYRLTDGTYRDALTLVKQLCLP